MFVLSTHHLTCSSWRGSIPLERKCYNVMKGKIEYHTLRGYLCTTSHILPQVHSLLMPMRIMCYRTPFHLTNSQDGANMTLEKLVYTSQLQFSVEEMKRFYDGDDFEYKSKLRTELKKIFLESFNTIASDTQKYESNTQHNNMKLGERDTERMLRELCKHRLLSYAEIVSAPTKFASLYEVLATFNLPLALLAAEHFTAATMLYTHFNLIKNEAKSQTDRYNTNVNVEKSLEKEQKVSGNINSWLHKLCTKIIKFFKLSRNTHTRNVNNDNNHHEKTRNAFDEEEQVERVHAYRVELQQKILSSIEVGNTIVCCARAEEQLFITNPSNGVRARYVEKENVYVLQGSTCATVGAGCADWALIEALVTRDVTKSNEETNINIEHINKYALFLVPMRNKRECMCGVCVRHSVNDNAIMREAAVGSIIFDHYRIPASHVFSCEEREYNRNCDSRFKSNKFYEQQQLSQQHRYSNALTVLHARSQIATAALSLGMLKKLIKRLVLETAHNVIDGPKFMPRYPYMGVQYVQTPICTLLIKLSVYNATWNVFLRKVNKTEAKTSVGSECNLMQSSIYDTHTRQTRVELLEAELKSCVELASLVYALQELLIAANTLAYSTLNSEYLLNTNDAIEIFTLLLLRKEKQNSTDTLRCTVMTLIENSSKFLSWKSQMLHMLHSTPLISFLTQKLYFSPKSLIVYRHRLLFSRVFSLLQEILSSSLWHARKERDAKAMWFDPIMEHHDHVLQYGQQYLNMVCIDAIQSTRASCKNKENISILNLVLLMFILVREKEALPFLNAWNLLTCRDGSKVLKEVDSYANALAMHAVNLVNTMQLCEEVGKLYSYTVHDTNINQCNDKNCNVNANTTTYSDNNSNNNMYNKTDTSCHNDMNSQYCVKHMMTNTFASPATDVDLACERCHAKDNDNINASLDKTNESRWSAHEYKTQMTNVQIDDFTEFDYLHGLDENVRNKCQPESNTSLS